MAGPDAAGHGKPVMLISLFDTRALAAIAARLQAAPPPAGVPVSIGSYGINRAQEAVVKGIPNALYAPMFSVQPETSRDARRRRPVSTEEAEALDAAFAGPVPQDPRIPVLP